MRRFFHPILSLALVIALSLTGHSMAVARGASAATGQMVICAGAESKLVFVDAQGAPTAPPHFCAECILLFAGASASVVSSRAPLNAATAYFERLRAAVPHRAVPQGFMSRAPPYSA